MQGNPDDEGIGLLTGEETAAPAKAPSAAPAATAGTPAAPTPPPAPRAAAPGLIDLKAAEASERAVTAGNVVTLSAVISSRALDTSSVQLTAEIAYTSTYPGEGAEWPISWMLPGKKTFSEVVARKTKANLTLTPNTPQPIAFEITAPVGVRYGDRIEVHLSATGEDGGRPAQLTMSCIARQAVLAIKTSRNYEREVADTLLTRAEEKQDVLFALLVPAALRGYVFAEGMSFEGVHEMLKGIRKARGLVAGETTLKEVEPLLVPKITVEGFVEGAIVELIAGPFKGEKARVRKIDQAKEEITVELIEAVVPIPVTIRGDHVRMLEKGGGKSGG